MPEFRIKILENRREEFLEKERENNFMKMVMDPANYATMDQKAFKRVSKEVFKGDRKEETIR